MTLATYAGLKARLAKLHSRSDIVDADYDDAVQLIESRVNASVRAPDMIEPDLAFAHTGRYTALPAGFLGMERAVFLTNGRRVEAEPLTGAQAVNYDDGGGGQACWYAIRGLLFEGVPSGDVTVEMHYYKTISTLVGSDANTNWLLAKFPAMYVYGCAAELALPMQDKDRIVLYAERYKAAREDLDKYIKRYQFETIGRGRAL